MTAPTEKQNIHEYLAEFDDIPGTRVFTVRAGVVSAPALIIAQGERPST